MRKLQVFCVATTVIIIGLSAAIVQMSHRLSECNGRIARLEEQAKSNESPTTLLDRIVAAQLLDEFPLSGTKVEARWQNLNSKE